MTDGVSAGGPAPIVVSEVAVSCLDAVLRRWGARRPCPVGRSGLSAVEDGHILKMVPGYQPFGVCSEHLQISKTNPKEGAKGRALDAKCQTCHWRLPGCT